MEAVRVDGAKVRRVRLSQGLTMQKLGKKVGINPTTIGRLEKGYTAAGLETVRTLAGALGVELEDLVVRE
jgi:transcriptional regulator with XRE-family HTH domain